MPLLRIQDSDKFVRVDDEIYDKIQEKTIYLKRGQPHVILGDHNEPLSRYVYRHYNRNENIEDLLIDKIDNDPLNCVIDNLRPASHMQDALNKRFIRNKVGLKNIMIDTWNKGKYRFKICVNRRLYFLGNFATKHHANFALHKFLELNFNNSIYKDFFRLSEVDDSNITTEEKLDIVARVSDYILSLEAIMHISEIIIDEDSKKYITRRKKRYEISIYCNSSRFYFGKYGDLEDAKIIRNSLIEHMNTVIRQFNRGEEIDFNIIHEVDRITDNPVVHKNFLEFLSYIESLS